MQARKPYTITKQREKWTDDEHALFLEALELHGRAWRRIEGQSPPAPLQTACSFVLDFLLIAYPCSSAHIQPANFPKESF